jgi:hypothetical protein
MSSSKPESPKDSPAIKKPATGAPSDRLAAALRDNLKRRKAQARARREPGPAATKAEPRRP